MIHYIHNIIILSSVFIINNNYIIIIKLSSVFINCFHITKKDICIYMNRVLPFSLPDH